jgi:single-strand DNA-binding protein
VNQVGIFGRLTRDPELRYTAQGKAVVRFTLALNRFGDNNEPDFFDCEAWEKQAENIANSCKKGHRLLVWGRLRQDRWTDQNQQNRSAIRIVVQGFSFIEPPPSQGQIPPQGPGYVPPPAPGGYPPPYPGQPGPGQYPPQQPPGQYRQGPPAGAPAGQPPAGQYGPPPAGTPGVPPGQPGQYQGQQGFSGNFDDIPF